MASVSIGLVPEAENFLGVRNVDGSCALDKCSLWPGICWFGSSHRASSFRIGQVIEEGVKNRPKVLRAAPSAPSASLTASEFAVRATG